jgi:hypothetical protein
LDLPYIDEIFIRTSGTATALKVGTYTSPTVAANTTSSFKPNVVLTEAYVEALPHDVYTEFMVFARNVYS